MKLVQRELAESRKASAALQQMVDALASLPALNHFVPIALRIVAEAFETTDCAYYEHRQGEPIRLRYWFFKGQVFGPGDIRAFADDHPYAGTKALEAGFVMPAAYLGVPFRKRIHAQVVDHSGDRPGDEWYDLRRRLDWYMSLNVPLVIGGEADGALLVNRGRGGIFTQSEIDLAERLAQQLALAMEIDRLAEVSKLAAIAQQRGRDAEERAAEFANANAVLRAMLDQLSKERDLHSFPRTILNEAMRQAGGRDALILLYDERTDKLTRSEYASAEGVIESAEFSRPFPASTTPAWTALVSQRLPIVFDVEKDAARLLPGLADWHRRRGNRSIIAAPMFIDSKPYGYFGITLAERAEEVSKVKVELIHALTQQATLAIQLAGLADESKQAAIAQEREKDAENRAAEFAKANDVLRSTLGRLSEQCDLAAFPRAILYEAMVQTDAQDAIILKFDRYSDSLIPSEYLNVDGAPPSKDLSRPYPTSKTSTWKTLVSTRAPAVFDVADNLKQAPATLSEWHDHRGNRSVVSVAMFIGQEPYGYFGITLRETATDVSNVKVGLIHALSQQATLAIQLTHLAEASQQAAVMLERQQVVVQERANMGREIHDRLAQGYAAILMQQHTMRRSLLRDADGTGEPSPLLKQLDIIERLSRENLADARRTMDELRLDPFGQSDLQVALRQSIGDLSQDRDFEVSLRLDEDLPPLRRYMTTELCRIVQEAVTNARKHSRGTSAKVIVVKAGGEVHLSVQDDGIGFDLQTIGSSFGIAGMHERAARAGSRLTLKSTPGQGTMVHVVVTL